MGDAAGIVDVFKEYSVEDPSAITPPGGTNVNIALTHTFTELEEDVAKPIRHQTIADDDRICFIELKKVKGKVAYDIALKRATAEVIDDEGNFREGHDMAELNAITDRLRDEYGATSEKGRGTLVAVPHDQAGNGRVPCYHLPWNPQGTAMELRIPDNGGGAASAANPAFFLTAALSGCSIYVAGTSRSPRVFHCGTEGKTGGATSKVFWDSVMTQLGVDRTSSIHASDYMNAKKGAPGAAVTHRQEAAKELTTHYKKALKIEKLTSWGAVFGARDGNGDWAFYLQQNTSVNYYRLRVTSVLKRRVKVDDPITVSRPIVLRKIFPNGGGEARLYEDGAIRALPSV